MSDDGRQLVSRQGAKFALWDVAPGLEYQTLPNPAAPGGEPLYYAGPCLSRDRRWLIVACGDGIRIWDLHARRLASFLPVGRVNFAFHGDLQCIIALNAIPRKTAGPMRNHVIISFCTVTFFSFGRKGLMTR